MKSSGMFILLLFYLSGVLGVGNVSDLENDYGAGDIKGLNGEKSFCVEYSENSDFYEEYDGACTVFNGEIFSFSGVNIGIEYIGSSGVKCNINGEATKLMNEGDKYHLKVPGGKEFYLVIYEVFFSERNEMNSGFSFRYDFEMDEEDSFCLEKNCTLYMKDELKVGDYVVKLENFFLNEEGLKGYDFEFEIDGEYFRENDTDEGEFVDFGEFEFFLVDIALKKERILFSHNEEWNVFPCNDSDGLDYYSQRNISGLYEDEDYIYGNKPIVPYVIGDYCYEINPFLVEFYCSVDGFIESKLVFCDKCIGGSCV